MARIAFALAGLVAAAALSPLPAADKSAPLSGKEIFQKVLKSAVWIAHATEVGNGRKAIFTGSGSLIDMDKRIVLTNFHVVGNQDAVSVFFPQYDASHKLISVKDHYMRQFASGGGLKGKVLYRDPKRDLALVQLPSLPAGVAAIHLARDSVGPGDTVHSIGNPGLSGALWAYTPGSVKSTYPKKWDVADPIERSIRHFEAQVVETTSPVNSGDSGGPLVNSAGELVAVTQGGVSAQAAQGTISYFIDISEVRTVLAAKKIRVRSAPTAVVASNTEPKSADKPTDPAVTEAERQETLAQNKLNFAEQYRDRPSKYREKLEEVVKRFPNTKAAKQAKDMLAKLKA